MNCNKTYFLEHYRFLFENGIRHIISLMKHQPEGAVTSLQVPKINRLKIRIEDFCAPTIEQIKQFIKFVEIANHRQEVKSNIFFIICLDRHVLSPIVPL